MAKPMRAFARADVRTGAALARLKPRNWLTPGAQSEALAAAYAQGPAPGTARRPPRDAALRLPRQRHALPRPVGLRHGQAPGRELGRPGYAPLGEWTLAQAVAASSCVPGAFGVVHTKWEPSALTGGTYKEPDRDRLVREIDLSDGGMFDNLGVEPVWRDHETVLVSDAAPSFKPDPDVGWLWSALRQGVILLEQATEVRKRWLVANFIARRSCRARTGASPRGPASYRPRGGTPPTPRS